MYDQGIGVKTNKAEAFNMFLQAAELNDPQAMYIVGAQTEGPRARRFLEESAKQGFVLSITALGRLDLKEGNKAIAFLRFKQAADLDEPGALMLAAKMVARGIGVKQNLRQATIWFERAHYKGDTTAAHFLNAIEMVNGDVMNKWLRIKDNSLSEAKKEASDFQIEVISERARQNPNLYR